MLENFETILRDRCGLNKAHPIIAGVSGGPDSLCLLDVLRRAGYPVVAAHFNHRLRPESGAEASYVQGIAARLKIESVRGSGDVRAYADEHSMTLEEAARYLRYSFLFGEASRREAQAVAVGHTADDQVETVLMHFLRGAGLTGLKGMSARTLLPTFDARIPVVRPLLDIWREETVQYCADHDLQPVIDPSNDSLEFMRNRLRKLLIPTLENYNPKFREAIWRSVQSLEADYELLREITDAAWDASVTGLEPDLITFEISSLMGSSPALQRSLIRRAIETLQPGQETRYELLQRATGYLSNPQAARIDLIGGLKLFREGSSLHVAALESDLPSREWPQMPSGAGTIQLSIPGEVELGGGWKLTCERWKRPALARQLARDNKDPFRAWLDAGSLPGPLVLRARKRGDRFEPLGMDGHSQKLSDFMVNEKIPRRARNRWPLLCSEDRLIWVPGHRPAHPYRLKPGSRRVVYFALVSPPKKTPAD